ncbi:precorrin-3B synthase [Sulfitobacter sp. HNIBRBA2951]|uniref:precorrin-3B synthase n=1 Tax=Sulfitobacter aquimarinus TaxID=3158557 RepID=UPI0032DE7BF2
MTAPLVKGWCPGALRPMMSGDGMVVRVRPFGGRLSRAQADAIASLAAAHGNGMLDLSSRANIQIRGVQEASHAPLIEGLRGMGLIDATPQIEGRRNIIVTPFWQPEDEAEGLVAALSDALAADDAPDLPVKFGFAVDTGAAPVLQSASADIRIERDAGGGLIVVADGMDKGIAVTSRTAVQTAIDVAHWFIGHAQGATRMAAVVGQGTLPETAVVPRQSGSYQPEPDVTPQGALVGVAFGQMQARTLAALAKHGALRLTPWRLVLVENARDLPVIDGVITQTDDPLLRITACTGAPACAQAEGETRSLARTLAPHLRTGHTLHVSGCAKGCAHPRAAPLTITAQPDGYALVKQGRAGDTPAYTALSSDDLKGHV